MPHHVSGINILVLSVNLISVPLSLTCLFMLLPHIFLLSQLTTLTVHKSLSLSLPVQDLPFPQIFPTIDSLPSSGLTPRLYDWSVSSEHLGFYSAPHSSHCKSNARIASAVLATATAIPSVCLSVCLSVTRRYCVKTTARSMHGAVCTDG